MTETNNVQDLLAKYSTDNSKLLAATAASYLPYIIVTNGMSEVVKQGKVFPGKMARMKDQTGTELATPLNAIFCVSQPRAQQTTADGLSITTDSDSAEYKRIVAVVASNAKNTGAMYGADFLVWLPDHNEFVSMFFSNASTRRMIAATVGMLGKPVQITVGPASNSKGDWFIPVITPSTTPHAPFTAEQLDEAMAKFKGQKPAEQPAAAGADAGRVR